MTKSFFIYIFIINVVTFMVYGGDKMKAKEGKFRVPEQTLLLLALAGGCYGAWGGMKYFHHKTKKATFTTFVPLFTVTWSIILAVILIANILKD